MVSARYVANRRRVTIAFDKEAAGLPEELKEKLAGCETREELLALAKEEGYELSDEDLQGIAGGDLKSLAACLVFCTLLR